MSHWLVYWVLMLDGIKSTMVGATVSVAIIFWIRFFYPVVMNGSLKHRDIIALKKLGKILIAPFMIFLLVSVFIPTTKQMAAIYLIPKIASNKDIKQLPPKLSKLALEYVNKELSLEEKK